MFRLLLLIFFLSEGTSSQAQGIRKNLDYCPMMVQELDSLRKNMHRLTDLFGSEIVWQDELGIRYRSSFELCGQPGILERLEDRAVFSFVFDDQAFAGTGDDFQRRFEAFFRELRVLLYETHYPTLRFLAADETRYEFFEHNKDAESSDQMVSLLLSRRPGFMKVVLSFTSRIRQKRAF